VNPAPDDRPPSDLPWRLPAFLLWCVLFAFGLGPEETFHALRTWGQVTTQRALVNSPHLITLALSVFLGLFTYFRAREAGCQGAAARGKATQMACIGLIAFSDVPLAFLLQLDEIPIAFYRNVLLGLAGAKMAAWVYALAVLFRYYFLSGQEVYRRLSSLFPSTRRDSASPVHPEHEADPAE
jgi:hypothetical protein